MSEAGSRITHCAPNDRQPVSHDGLTVALPGQVLESVAKRSTLLELLASDGKIEVTRQSIRAGKHFYIYASDTWSGFELIYVMSGELLLDDTRGRIRVGAGGYLHHAGLSEKAFLRVQSDVELLMVASPPGYHLMREGIEDMLQIAQAVELKDRETNEHCSRIEHLAVRAGEMLGMSGQELIDLSYAASLHDIGKVGVPDQILGKDASLTESEWEMMKRHPEHGAELLWKRDFLGDAGSIVAAHHERFNGSGYPKGLKGEEIPLGARIIAVVDTYDAMTMERAYGDAKPSRDAQRELREQAGTLYDPDVVKAFLSVIEQDADD